jgi:hypothetical protein
LQLPNLLFNKVWLINKLRRPGQTVESGIDCIFVFKIYSSAESNTDKRADLRADWVAESRIG